MEYAYGRPGTRLIEMEENSGRSGEYASPTISGL